MRTFFYLFLFYLFLLLLSSGLLWLIGMQLLPQLSLSWMPRLITNECFIITWLFLINIFELNVVSLTWVCICTLAEQPILGFEMFPLSPFNMFLFQE